MTMEQSAPGKRTEAGNDCLRSLSCAAAPAVAVEGSPAFCAHLDAVVVLGSDRSIYIASGWRSTKEHSGVAEPCCCGS